MSRLSAEWGPTIREGAAIEVYVTLKVDRYSVEVAVVGIDGRMVQSGEAYLLSAVERVSEDIIDENPRNVPIPGRNWEWMGFTVEVDDSRYIKDIIRAIEAEVKGTSWLATLQVGRGRWLKPPVV